jgi:NDP-sugar pyrophosphorylase family protein
MATQSLLPSTTPQETDVVILCGGLGTRLRSVVSDRPKPMADVNGRPFLDRLMTYVADYGFRRCILCIGHMGDRIKRYYGERSVHPLTILFSEESEPLGTAGAVKHAEPFIRSDHFLLMNGDSWCPVDLRDLLEFHTGKEALASLTLVRVEEADNYGTVTLREDSRVIGFEEKRDGAGGGLVNGGIYLLRKEFLGFIPSERKLSLECDIFPRILTERVYGYVTNERLIDIGVPERYGMAQEYFKEV